MNLLLEIGHPAHVHFFKNAIRQLEEGGWNVLVVARDKAETIRLLQDEGIKYLVHSMDSSNFRKITSLVPGALKIYKIAKQFQIDVIAGISPVFSALVKRILRIPLISFTDTDSALEQIMIFAPHSTSIHTPRSFRWNLGKRQKRYPGFHELAYLHPTYFKPNREILDEVGLLDNGPPIILRIIKWSATHDFGVKRISWEAEFIEKYEKTHRIIVSSEGKIPRQFRKYANPLEPSDFHHLLAFARLYIGSGGTTASESAMLGVPAIYTNPLPAGIFEELQDKYKLVYHLLDKEKILAQAATIMAQPLEIYKDQQKIMLKECIDVTEYIVNTIESSVNQ